MPESSPFSYPSNWNAIEKIPDVEWMCETIRNDSFIADHFFFPESNNPENFEDGTYWPLFDFQGHIEQTIEDNNVIFIIAARGSSKSSSIARWAVKYGLRNRNQKIVFTAPSFRQSRADHDYCMQIYRNNCDPHALYKLAQEMPEDPKRGHEVIATLSTGTTLQALPMGKGETSRGTRATVLVCEEFYLMDRTMHDSHIMPFLNVQIGAKKPKVIYITTSFYQDCFAYETLMNIARNIKRGVPGYAIIDLTVDDVLDSTRVHLPGEPDVLDTFPAARQMILHQLETQRDETTGRLTEDAMMTFYNVWPKTSANFYRSDIIAGLKDDTVPVLTEKPEKWADSVPFVLGVDPAAHGVDACAMAVESLPGNEERDLHAVYKWNKLRPEEIAGKIHQMVDRYGMYVIVMDKSGSLGAIIADKCTSEMQLIDGVLQKRDPIYPWDHPDAAKGRAVIVQTKPSDERIQAGVFSDRFTRQVTGEIELKNAFHISMKANMENGKFRVPMAIEEADYYDAALKESLRGEIMDNIREAMAQFPRIDRERNNDANKTIKVDGRGNFYFKRPPHDDCAYAIVYADWAANIVYKQTPVTHNREVAVVWESTALKQSVESLIPESQIDRPRLF